MIKSVYSENKLFVDILLLNYLELEKIVIL